uniref:SCO family protein n=1 Tax=Halomonas sp. TaxID=1486246 RepID=UPI0026338815|nr:SCO family protein [Halomonas sp.]
MNRRYLGLGACAIVILAAAVLWTLKPWENHSPAEGSIAGGPIELPSTEGDFSLASLADDQVAVVFFGYTWCPDVCPMSLSVMRQTLDSLPQEQQKRVVPVLISLDPERDSIERLREYLGFFGDGFIGATGSRTQLEDIAERYDVVWRKVEAGDSEGEYTIDHTAYLYLVDSQGGVLQRVLHSPTPAPLQAALTDVLAGD